MARSYILSVSVILAIWPNSLNAQSVSDSIAKDEQRQKLPFAISKEKKLPEEELASKKEGVYVTGIPDVSSDPVNGIRYGGEGTVFFNGKRSDPFFEYTPYRAAISFAIFNTTKNQRELKIGWDIPYIFDSKWRIRGEVAFENNPNLLYFGINEQTLNGLSYYPDGDSTRPRVDDARYKPYEESLVGDNKYYNEYTKKESILNISAERSFMQGKLRLLVGYELAGLHIIPYEGNSYLQNDFNIGLVKGVGKNAVSFVQLGMIYDTRDLEPDPSNGVFAELTNEASLTALGSQFGFNKTFIHYNYYKKLFPQTFRRLVFAGRIAMGYTAGNSPFYEYHDQWSSEGSIEGLGGGSTIRGFKQSRFVSRAMQFTNLELRIKFMQFDFLKQNFAFSAVPFFDAGGVWNSLDRVPSHLENLRYSEGLGLRVAWNVSTILRFDYAYSKEDNQFFFMLEHAF